MQDDLFGAPPAPPPTRPKPPAAEPDTADDDEAAPALLRKRAGEVRPLPPDATTRTLAACLNPRIRLGASTWSYPGWAGIVWDEGQYSEAVLPRTA